MSEAVTKSEGSSAAVMAAWRDADRRRVFEIETGTSPAAPVDDYLEAFLRWLEAEAGDDGRRCDLAQARAIWELFSPGREMPGPGPFLDLWVAQREVAFADAIFPYPSKHDLDGCLQAPAPALFLAPGRGGHGALVWAWPAPNVHGGDNFRFAGPSAGIVMSYDRSHFFFLDGEIAEFMRLVKRTLR